MYGVSAVQHTEQKQAALRQSVEELRNIVAVAETRAVNVKSFLKKYTEPTELTPALLGKLAEKWFSMLPINPAD